MNAILAGLFVLIGIGLLRLDNRARLAVFVVVGLSVANALVLATPWGRTRMDHSIQQMFATMKVPSYGMEAILHSPLLWVFTGAFWVVLYGAIIWVLQRYRRDFKAGGAVAVQS